MSVDTLCSEDRPIEAVLFDLDGTLCRYHRSSEELLEAAFSEVGVEPFFDASDYRARIGEFIDEASDKGELRELCFEAIAEEEGVPKRTGRRLGVAYTSLRDHADVEFLPCAEELLRVLDGEFTTGVVTNGDPRTQRPKFRSLGLDDAFDVVVYAGHNADYKPSPEPFRQALDQLALAPAETVYVGDSMEFDVVGANRVGMYTVWVSPGQDSPCRAAEPDVQVSSLCELVDAVRRSTRSESNGQTGG